MTVTDWADIRGASGTAGSATHTRPDPLSWRASSADAGRPGQLADVAARAGRRQAALDLPTRATVVALVVLAGVDGGLHQQAVAVFSHHHWVASSAALTLLAWPSSLAQQIACLTGAIILLGGIIASSGMRNVDDLRGGALLLGGGVAFVGLLPLVCCLLMYLGLGVLFLGLCVLGLILAAMVIGALLGAL